MARSSSTATGSSTSARRRTSAALASGCRHRRWRPVRRHARAGQHAHPHHRRAAHPRLRPRRHAVRGERVRVAVPALLRVRRRPRSGSRRNWRRSRCSSPAPRRSSRRARSASSTRWSTGSSRSASAAGSGAGCGTCRPSPTSTARPPTRRSPTSNASSTDRADRVGRRTNRHVVDPRRPHDVLRPAVAGGPRSSPTEHGVGHELPHVARPSSIPTGSSPSSGSARWSTSTSSACSAPDVAMTHCVHVDDHEIESMVAPPGVSVAHCPTTALKVSYGVTQIGKMPGDGAGAGSTCRSAPTATTPPTTPT